MAAGESPCRIARDIISYRPLNVPRLEHKRGLRDFMGGRYTHVYVEPAEQQVLVTAQGTQISPG